MSMCEASSTVLSKKRCLSIDEGVIVHKYSVSQFEWHIHNFCTTCKTVGECLYSPVFTICNLKCMKWRLLLYPKGEKTDNTDFMSLYIVYLGHGEIIAKIDFSLLSTTNNLTLVEKNIKYTKYITNYNRGFSNYTSRLFVTDLTNKLLMDGTLKILCKITVDMQSNNFHCNSDQYRQPKKFCHLEKLMETGNYSDIIFNVGEEKLKAHKAIVACGSPVFEAMFEHGTSENKNNQIEITDIKPEVMKEVLRYIYAGRVVNIDEIACDLLKVAEKYFIDGLKLLCEKTLCANLKVDNALEYLQIANMYNAVSLKLKVMDFIVEHQKVIVKDPKFELFAASDPKLLYKMTLAIVSKNSS